MNVLTFYAIAYQYQEEVYYDFATKEDVVQLEPTCLLPTEELALSYIEDELSIDYIPVEITVEKFNPNELVYSRAEVERWDY